MLYSGKKYCCEGPLISEKDQQAPGFKAGRERLTVQFGADALGL